MNQSTEMLLISVHRAKTKAEKSDLSRIPFRRLKGARVRVTINGRSVKRSFDAEILNTSPYRMPWRSYLVNPVNAHPYVMRRWVKQTNLKLLELNHETE